MKKIISLSLIIISLFALVGCTERVNENGAVSFNDVVENIKDVIREDLKGFGYTDEDFAGEELPGYFELDLRNEEDRAMFDIFNENDFDDAYVIQPMMNLSSNLIIIVKAKDSASVNNLKEGLEEVRDSQESLWSQYLPDQYEKVKNNIIKVEGDYLIYITYDDAEKIEEVFVNTLK